MSELTQREKDLGWCEEAQTYCSVAEDRYKQGRSEAIDEAICEIQDAEFMEYEKIIVISILEQLKEQKNE